MSHAPGGDLKTNRVEALSDGVFAIAMTLLILGITVPSAATVPAEQLPVTLRAIAPQILVYVISFANLGVLWIGQQNQYRFIVRVDRWFLWINIGYLLLISFVPLSTALLGHYPLSRPALIIYGVNVIVATLVLALHWDYATRNHRLTNESLSPLLLRRAHGRLFAFATAYATAVLLSLAVPLAGLALFLAAPFLNILPLGLDHHFAREKVWRLTASSSAR